MKHLTGTAAKERTESPALLQPLKEIGTEDKTQYWEFDDISRALREARRLGIDPATFFHRMTEEGRLAKAG